MNIATAAAQFLLLIGSSVCANVLAGDKGSAGARDYPIHRVPFTNMALADGFWKQRIDVNRNVTLPHTFRQSETTGRIANFSIAGGLSSGKFCGYQFNDSDVFKIIEGASYEIALTHDAGLERYVDSLIAQIAAAQEADGYLYTARKLMSADYSPPGGKERWIGEKDGSHELYNAGHLYEAAVAHAEATGKKTLLEVALKNANLVCSTFGPGGRKEVPGHQEIEIGLCRLYRYTGEAKYLSTAKFFLEQRGNAQGHELIGEYAQDHIPVLKQDKAVGHAVRAMYMYSAMADISELTGDPGYAAASAKLWDDVVGSKMYVTGGIGQTGSNEGFGKPFDLPNKNAYCETCASIAFIFWSDRLFRIHGDGKYYDALERTLYNSFLSGTALAGDKFFYPNPLASFGGAERSGWFNCACCPSNIVRFVPTIPGYAYSQKGDSLYVNLFMAGTASLSTGASQFSVTQQTAYPYEGTVSLRIGANSPFKQTLFIRIPGWAENTALHGDLYNFLDPIEESVRIMIDGKPVAVKPVKGYLPISRTWKDGDNVSIEFPMPVRRVIPDPKVIADLGRVSLQRGPLMYCIEGIDNNGTVFPLVLNDIARLTPGFRNDLLGGLPTVAASVYPMQGQLEGPAASGEMRQLTAIPYFAWANRERTPMAVWLAASPRMAYPVPAPTIAFNGKLTSSGGTAVDAVKDQILPANSADESVPLCHWWPEKGKDEWLQYEFEKKTTVSSVKVYWFDDTGIGECRIPAKWRIEYRDGSEWKPVQTSVYPVELNKENAVTFTAVETDGLRLVLTMKPDFSAGVFEWSVQ